MSYPKIYRDLFQNDGAGSKLREDILPDMPDTGTYIPKTGNAGVVSSYGTVEKHTYKYVYAGGNGDDVTISLNINSGNDILYYQTTEGDIVPAAPAQPNVVTFNITAGTYDEACVKRLCVDGTDNGLSQLGSVVFSGTNVVNVNTSEHTVGTYELRFSQGKVYVTYLNPGYSYGTTDLTAGTSPLETGKLYFVYE
jgi:hypothetical protein